MQVKINLNNPPTSPTVNVDLQWNIQVTEPKSGFFAGIFRRHNHVSRDLRISVSDLHVPDEVVCDRSKLFSILYRDRVYPQSDFPVDVELTDMAMPFQLLFHQGEIKDCKRPQDANPRSYEITFKVDLLDPQKNNKTIDSVDESIELLFEPLGVKPRFAIDLEDDEIQYSASMHSQKVGIFAAWLDEPFQFTPEQLASVVVKLYKGTTELPGLISFGEKGPRADIRIKAGRPNVVRLPIYIDFSTIPNPLTNEEDFTIETTTVLSAAYSPEVKEPILKQTHFRLLKDQQGTELRISLRVPEKDTLVYDGRQSLPSIPLNFVPRSLLRGQVDVILSNIATDNSNSHAGLRIKNLTLTEVIPEDVKVVGEDNSLLSHFVSIDGPGVERMNSADGLFIPNGDNARTVVHVYFNPSAIVDLINSRNYNFKVQSILTFDYWEDKAGLADMSDDTRKEGKIPITWQLHLEPNPEWLCVDYGSSAIVCLYDNDILKLRRQKSRIFREAENGKFHLDTIEGGTQFLSSDIVLHNVSDNSRPTLCTQQAAADNVPYLNLSVCLSPTSSLIKDEVRRQLPCLKILVGNEYLPPKPDFMTFQYTRRDNNGNTATVVAKDTKNRGEETCILKISSIFNEAYASLFRYFIQPSTQDKSINKLVLTYPNTYTPAHLKLLGRIARDTFPKVRDGYMRFVSESDAVAAYYLQNWDSFNSGRNITADETVLVYDMGAGTLDLTLFKKQLNNDGKIEVRILGKIGSGRAGNYLDYLISEIIADKVPEAVRQSQTVSTVPEPDVQTLEERLEVKQTVKNSIKPNLLPDRELICGNTTFSSQTILDDSRFNDFLSQVTEGIIKHLLSYVGDPLLKIDTVLMSGRSCRLEALQKALRKALGQRVRIVKFASDGDKEKTVVVEGAMVRAALFSSPESPVRILSRRLYASYGLVYKKLGGRYCYAELLKSSDLPFEADNTGYDDYEGKNVTVRGTAAAGTIKLIQTYLSPADTEKAYNDGDFEFISEMEEYDMANFGGRDELNVRLKLDYKNNISLYVNGLISIGSSPKGVDLDSEITKRSIWPVTI